MADKNIAQAKYFLQQSLNSLQRTLELIDPPVLPLQLISTKQEFVKSRELVKGPVLENLGLDNNLDCMSTIMLYGLPRDGKLNATELACEIDEEKWPRLAWLVWHDPVDRYSSQHEDFIPVAAAQLGFTPGDPVNVFDRPQWLRYSGFWTIQQTSKAFAKLNEAEDWLWETYNVD